MKISIIVPVHNEEKLIKQCILSLINQNYDKNSYEVIIVNDGSTDNTKKIILDLVDKNKGYDVKLINQKNNLGRSLTRENGAKKAKYENLLFMDSRCRADKNLLINIKKIGYQPLIGNVIQTNTNIFDRFFYLVRKRLYGQFFDSEFKPIYITKNNFDKIPKGTGIFLCNKELFLNSQIKNNVSKNSSDDTKLLYNITKKRKILKHPLPKVIYSVRSDLLSNVNHIYKRGTKFVDYYLNLKKEYFWVFISLPIIGLFFTIALIFFNLIYFLYWLGFLVLVWVLISIWFAENIKDFFIIMILLAIIGFSFELGILKGLILKLVRIY